VKADDSGVNSLSGYFQGLMPGRLQIGVEIGKCARKLRGVSLDRIVPCFAGLPPEPIVKRFARQRGGGDFGSFRPSARKRE